MAVVSVVGAREGEIGAGGNGKGLELSNFLPQTPRCLHHRNRLDRAGRVLSKSKYNGFYSCRTGSRVQGDGRRGVRYGKVSWGLGFGFLFELARGL